MTVDFEPWQYIPVQGDLSLGSASPEPPPGWDTALRATEEPLETLLAFNLASVTGLPLTFLNRAVRIEPAVDIVATDPIRRIHIFELKKRSVSGQVAAQLEHYLLSHLFQDPDEYLQTVAARGTTRTSPDQTARHVCGLYANERMTITGVKKIIEQLGSDHPAALDENGHVLSRRKWDRLTKSEQLQRVHPAIAAHAAARGIVDYPDLDTILDQAHHWSKRLTPVLPLASLVAERRLVLWLVGRSISPEALEQVRMWRRAGIDARPLLLDLRHLPGQRALAVKREQARGRGAIEQELFDDIHRNPHLQGTVRLDYYETKAASAGRRHGGELADNPKATITASDGATSVIRPEKT